MPRVFVVNEPLRRNKESGELEQFLPMESARDFGDVVELTPKGSPPANMAPYLKMIRNGLNNWEDGDFIVLVGDQALLAYAAFVLGEITEAGDVLRFLKWERRLGAYAPLIVRDGPIESA